MRYSLGNPTGSWQKAIVSLVVGSMVAGACFGVGELQEPATWTPNEESGVRAIETETYGLVSVEFRDRTGFPENAVAVLAAGGDAEASVFAGNYLAAGIEGVSFKLRNSEGFLPDLKQSYLFIRPQEDAGGMEWRSKNINWGTEPNVWAESAVSLNKTLGQWETDAPAELVNWSDDLQHVYAIGLRIAAGNPAQQTFEVDDFVLVGDGFTTAPASLTPIILALRERFQRYDINSLSDLTAEEAAADEDEDGMSDLSELLAGTNPDDGSDKFMAQVAAVDAAGITISWKGVAGGRYTISKATTLDGGGDFAALTDPDANRKLAMADGEMTYTDTSVVGQDGPFFYRVTKVE